MKTEVDSLQDYYIELPFAIYQGTGKAHIARVPLYKHETYVIALCGKVTLNLDSQKLAVITRGEVCKRCRHLYNYDK